MKNEFGERLDRNGYARSILQTEAHCFYCYHYGPRARHEIFHGPNRRKSKELDLWVELCPLCHNEVHNGDGSLDRKLKALGQTAAMVFYGWTVDEFRERFGKNYAASESV